MLLKHENTLNAVLRDTCSSVWGWGSVHTLPSTHEALGLHSSTIQVGVVKQAYTPSTWEMEDNRFKTIFNYKQIQSQTDEDERRQKVA